MPFGQSRVRRPTIKTPKTSRIESAGVPEFKKYFNDLNFDLVATINTVVKNPFRESLLMINCYVVIEFFLPSFSFSVEKCIQCTSEYLM